MAQWVIDTNPQQKERDNIARLGKDVYDLRIKTAKAKAEELEDWREAMFMATQFESVAVQLSGEQFEKMKNLSGDRWAKLIYKLAAK